MREKEGTAIIHVIGTTPQGLPVTLAGAYVEIHKVADSDADADEAGDRDGVAIANDRHGFIWADDLSEHLTGDRSAT